MALDSITQMPNLPITSAFKASLPAAPKGRIGPAEIAPAAEELSSAISTASQKVGEADVNIEKAKREEQAIGFEKRAEGKRKFVEDIKIMPEREAYKEVVKQERGMEFVPTRDTVQDIAGLFGLLGVVGMVIGKGNAMQAMGAMNGMMEGHRKGRQDLYKQELQQFEKNFKAMQAKVSAALADLQEALKVKQYDNEAGDLEIQAVLARSESPFLKAVKDKQGDAAVLERLKEVNKSVTVDMPRTINDLQEKADAKVIAESRFNQEMAQRERIARENRISADERARLGRLDKEGKLSPAERKEVRGINNLSDEIQRLKDTFKPDFVNFKFDVMGDVAAKVRSRIADDPAMAEWWRRYENVALPERHAMFGATLTGKEQESWRKASIGTGNSTKEVLSWIADKEEALNNKLSGYEKTAASRPSQPTQGQYQQEAIRRFGSYDPSKYDYGYENGKFYRDAK